MEVVTRLQSKHWSLLLGFASSTALVIGGLDHWGDLFHTKVAAGLIGQLVSLVSAVYVGAPINPQSRHHEHRRKSDTVSNETRAKLP